METNKLIDTRHETHGRYEDTAKIAQNLKNALGINMCRLEAHQRESLHMICVKMARILNGNPKNEDHWDDIAGYAQLGKNPNR